MNVYEIVTNQIISQLEKGVVPWRKPWRTELPCNLISGKEYRGINTFLLGTQGLSSKYWLTAKQAASLGAHVRAGEKASIVTFWNVGKEMLNKKTGEVSKPFLLRFYSVYNASQIDGLDSLKLGNPIQPVPNIPECESIIANMQNRPRLETSNAAWYRPASDTVGMPSRALFQSPEEFYSTFFHELVHCTGHASRVGRERIENINSFGSESYSKEELIAELGASMLCGLTGIAPSTLENSTAYLQSWIRRLRGDARLILSAASAAQKAADYIRNTSVREESEVAS
jgi:antirestriction protein ArdC